MKRLAIFAAILLLGTPSVAEETPTPDSARARSADRPDESKAETEAKEETQPEWGRGPFEIADPFILGELRAAPYARSPRTLKPLEFEVGARVTWVNSYGVGDDTLDIDPATGKGANRFLLDAETRGLDLVARAGVLPRIELGFELRTLHWRGGGSLDPLIRQFHRSTGIGSLGRDRVDNDGFFVQGREPGGNSFQLKGRGTRIGDAAASVRVLALEGGTYHPALAVGFRLWIPTASPGLDHARGLAETISVDLSKRLGDLPLIVYAGASLTLYDQSTIHGLHLERERIMGWVGLEWQIFSRLSAVVHFWQESRRERSLYRSTNIPYGNYVQYIAGGFKVEPIDGLTIEIGVLEDGIDPNTTGDFGFLFNVWYRFGPL